MKFFLIVFSIISFCPGTNAQSSRLPNIIFIITDDQGYGDLGSSGNTLIHTPTIDSLEKQSIRFNNFYVSPVCAPTRASLITGRYSLRTGVRDTYNGGATMASNEITMAEMLKATGYTTGLFGKWHLGDNYPFRPIDQGFDESVMHLAGGMGQVGDVTTYFKGDSSYFNPVLWNLTGSASPMLDTVLIFLPVRLFVLLRGTEPVHSFVISLLMLLILHYRCRKNIMRDIKM